MAVILDITISLDGFVTGPHAGPDNGLGDGGTALHEWAVGDRTDDDLRVLATMTAATGAVVMGRHTFDVVDAPDGWGDGQGYGADQGDPDHPLPCFVVTHHEPDHVRLTDRMTIVTTGLRDALDQAAAVAGDKDVVVMGGGELGGAALRDGRRRPAPAARRPGAARRGECAVRRSVGDPAARRVRDRRHPQRGAPVLRRGALAHRARRNSPGILVVEHATRPRVPTRERHGHRQYELPSVPC